MSNSEQSFVKKSVGLLLLTALIAFYATGVVSSQLVGGLNDERAADERIRNVVQSVRPDFERRYEHEISSLEPLSYRTQVVSGMNYFVKALVTDKDGNKSHVHLRIYKPFKGTNELTAIKTNVGPEHPLKYFQ